MTLKISIKDYSWMGASERERERLLLPFYWQITVAELVIGFSLYNNGTSIGVMDSKLD